MLRRCALYHRCGHQTAPLSGEWVQSNSAPNHAQNGGESYRHDASPNPLLTGRFTAWIVWAAGHWFTRIGGDH